MVWNVFGLNPSKSECDIHFLHFVERGVVVIREVIKLEERPRKPKNFRDTDQSRIYSSSATILIHLIWAENKSKIPEVSE
jgi:hypothetical protein